VPDYTPLIAEHVALTRSLYKLLDTDPRRVIEVSRRGLRQMRALVPDELGDEISVDAMIETYEDLIERAERVLAGRGMG
jgi:hypothetical protein